MKRPTPRSTSTDTLFPYTTRFRSDFLDWWEDVANNPELSPSGPPVDLVVEGKHPTVEFLDETTVRYTWPSPNPAFLPALAGASPTIISAPSPYLKQFPARYPDAGALKQRIEGARKRNWPHLNTTHTGLTSRRERGEKTV